MKYLLVLLLLIAVPVSAAPAKKAPAQTTARKSCKKCPPAEQCPPSHHCSEPAGPPAPVKVEPNEFQKGFEVVAGFRWDRKLDCPTYEDPKPEPEYTDPIFIGLQQRLPLNEYWTLQARVDRDLFDDHGDWIATPHWNAAVSLHWAPWR